MFRIFFIISGWGRRINIDHGINPLVTEIFLQYQLILASPFWGRYRHEWVNKSYVQMTEFIAECVMISTSFLKEINFNPGET